jgi:hypothetical protein
MEGSVRSYICDRADSRWRCVGVDGVGMLCVDADVDAPCRVDVVGLGRISGAGLGKRGGEGGGAAVWRRARARVRECWGLRWGFG